MSQAEQVPEDMPAYLNDESVTTGKCGSLWQPYFSVLRIQPNVRLKVMLNSY